MAWKKIILSGSDATLNTLSVDGNITGTFVGALSSSAQIASEISGALSNNAISDLGAGIISSSAQIDSDFFDIDGLVSSSTQVVTLLDNQSVDFGTGAVTASFFRGDGSQLTNLDISQTATVVSDFTNVTTHTVSHNFGTKNVMATVYDDNDFQIIPGTVQAINDNQLTITFDSSTSGTVIIGKGGHVVSGSVPFDNLLNKPTLVSSSIAGDAQGQVKINGVNIDIPDLQTNDSPTFASLTLTGDLTVQGDTTTLSTTNLLVEDKFILLNSGSANPDQGGIIIDEGSGTGHAFAFSGSRFGYAESLASNATSVTPTAFAAAVVDIDAGQSDIPEYQKNGNIKTDSGTVWIYA